MTQPFVAPLTAWPTDSSEYLLLNLRASEYPFHVISSTLTRHERTGDLRFRLPVPNSPYTGNVDATQFGSPCSQQLTNITIPDTLSKNVSDVITGLTGRIFSPMPGSENCLFLNVFAPPQANTKSNLPVVMVSAILYTLCGMILTRLYSLKWIPGGGFW